MSTVGNYSNKFTREHYLFSLTVPVALVCWLFLAEIASSNVFGGVVFFSKTLTQLPANRFEVTLLSEAPVNVVIYDKEKGNSPLTLDELSLQNYYGIELEPLKIFDKTVSKMSPSLIVSTSSNQFHIKTKVQADALRELSIYDHVFVKSSNGVVENVPALISNIDILPSLVNGSYLYNVDILIDPNYSDMLIVGETVLIMHNSQLRTPASFLYFEIVNTFSDVWTNNFHWSDNEVL